jgi:hypothetical protein
MSCTGEGSGEVSSQPEFKTVLGRKQNELRSNKQNVGSYFPLELGDSNREKYGSMKGRAPKQQNRGRTREST